MRSLYALAAVALLVLPATAASAGPATSGMSVPMKAVEAEGKALDVLLLYSCEPKGETAILTVSFGQPKSPLGEIEDTAPAGRLREKVECGTLRRHSVRVPVKRNGPLVAGEMTTITTELHSTEGVKLHSTASTKKVAAGKKKRGGTLGKKNPLGSPLSGLFGSLVPR
ncbi:hypothetical protein GCM10022221_77450 [Actinocorallia aurea]